MTTYYCHSIEEALRRAKIAGRKPGCYLGGITLPSGRRGFAIYCDGKGKVFGAGAMRGGIKTTNKHRFYSFHLHFSYDDRIKKA